MFSQIIVDLIGSGIGFCIYALIPLAFGGAIHAFVMGHRKHNLALIREANGQVVSLRKIDIGYQKDSDIYTRRCYGLYC